MAVDTAAKRRAAMGARTFFFRRHLPLPTGTVTATVRANLLGHYQAGAAPAVTIPTINSGDRSTTNIGSRQRSSRKERMFNRKIPYYSQHRGR